MASYYNSHGRYLNWNNFFLFFLLSAIFGANDDAMNANYDELVVTDMGDIGAVFSRHVVKGIYTLRQFAEAGCMELTSVSGDKIRVLVENRMVQVNDALLVTPDMIGTGQDGIIQGIDKMLTADSFVPCPVTSNEVTGRAEDPDAVTMDTGSVNLFFRPF